ncbi:MAG: carbohydrate-binding family 9-like protein [Chloroflexota bacterium]
MSKPMIPQEPVRYVCYRTEETLTVNGRLDHPAWQLAPKSRRFVDMASGAPGYYDTRMAALWNDTHLHIGFWVEEPFVEAHHTERDAIIFQENDVEIFIDGGDCYYELELNALGTIYEVLFIWRDAYRRGSRFDVPEFDLLDRQPLTFGGDYDRTPASFWRGTHPRGLRWAFLDWDLPGLQVATHIEGTLNDHSDLDKGWTAEIALPWSGMNWLANGRSLPPQNGDEWRIFFGRFQKLLNAGQEVQPHPAWVLSPHGVYDTHQPDRFPIVTFSTETVKQAGNR